MARILIEEVHEAIFDLVKLIKTFRGKNKLSRLLMSTPFKRRQEELDAVVDRAITRLQVRMEYTGLCYVAGVVFLVPQEDGSAYMSRSISSSFSLAVLFSVAPQAGDWSLAAQRVRMALCCD